MTKPPAQTNAAEGRPDRGDATRQKLLLAAIDVFGRMGFDGATTRALADAAGVNLQAIPYYFGGKEGLYIAAAEHIASLISGHVGHRLGAIRERLALAEREGAMPTEQEARDLLGNLVETMAELLVSPRSEPWARFLLREQMEPTEAFQRVYRSLMQPMLGAAGRLVGLILREDPASEHVRMRTLSLAGGVMVFRMAHAAAMAELGWHAIGPSELASMRALSRELVASLSSKARLP